MKCFKFEICPIEFWNLIFFMKCRPCTSHGPTLTLWPAGPSGRRHLTCYGVERRSLSLRHHLLAVSPAWTLPHPVLRGRVLLRRVQQLRGNWEKRCKKSAVKNSSWNGDKEGVSNFKNWAKTFKIKRTVFFFLFAAASFLLRPTNPSRTCQGR